MNTRLVAARTAAPRYDPSDPLAFFRSLPPAPNVDIDTIKGNLSEDQKKYCANALAYFISSGNSWGTSVGQRLKFLAMDVVEPLSSTLPGGSWEARTVLEIKVTQDMCNLFGVLHGGCAAYLIDPASSSALVALGVVLGIDGTGMSQSMNIIWHQPVPL
ncbi:hypothetical protein ONZ45_g5082 [Pleurotus djamor]|nr:hypothetical protein ONZ45_g5082 [Pleurotus djamor]